MQNLEPILIFLRVAEMESFTHAADSLGIQKGRASTAVRRLEENVGVRLLHRTTRSVQLTEDGRAFHARARNLLADVDDLHSMFAGDRVALRGRLRSICRRSWRARRSCRRCRLSWPPIPNWNWRYRARIGRLIWSRRGLIAFCGLDRSEMRR